MPTNLKKESMVRLSGCIIGGSTEPNGSTLGRDPLQMLAKRPKLVRALTMPFTMHMNNFILQLYL
jgi:hypothetical protein